MASLRHRPSSQNSLRRVPGPILEDRSQAVGTLDDIELRCRPWHWGFPQALDAPMRET
jgi:hypothetical protein